MSLGLHKFPPPFIFSGDTELKGLVVQLLQVLNLELAHISI